ncbi:putative mannose-1-phosphate guanylyltransferase [Candidatus Kuenenia stuttgartiensis]|uniref:Putative mannose-1-phosphate guanylyltransferase n=1 Tax=Kuenenia stuttgartiensis TaxID=174633 RepID=Q1Q6W7_KUEST|nr:HAD-IIIA family hydrolase [Candidatus Kuenenia stuttgartiensis]QII12875.1 putative mannose-1-phosphate guanylyltransferase [Candidatus Kuenenia stuttgartiensis]CAJ73316.1 conserved hypothetical protein [Candidatus Kuenenia stuttgartiensis]
MKVVILAGGKGTRMGSLSQNIPKPMINIANKPILQYQIEIAKRFNLTDIILLTGYKGEVVEDYFGNGENWGVNISCYRETIPLGTAGAVKEVEDYLHDDFLVFYGDVIMDIDLKSVIRYHMKRKPIATLVVHPNDHPYDSDLIEVNNEGKVITFHSKPHKQDIFIRNLVNAALYILSPRIMNFLPKGTYSDFGKDIFPKLVNDGEIIYAYNTPEYIKDIGTLERLEEVERDIVSGKLYRLNKKNKRKAIFLDRDGVLNYEIDLLRTPEELELLPDVPNAIKKINTSEYLSVVVTNQPVVAKGLASEKDIYQIHSKLDTVLGRNRAFLDRIYYCPHHPEKGFHGERIEYKIHCDCRKPNTGMINQAVYDLNIDLDESFIIGDRTVDILTGINAGLKTILVRTGYAGDDGVFQCEPDFIFSNLKESTEFIIDCYDALVNKAKDILSGISINNKRNIIILIAGLSRSGKSTFSKIISTILNKKGIHNTHLNLDNWLVGIQERKDWMAVSERYKYNEIVKDIATLLEGKEIKVNKYNVKTRNIDEHQKSIILKEGEALIIDGVVGLDIEFLRKIADIKIYVEINETMRRKRFFDFYMFKGLTEEEIKKLYVKRQDDEIPIVIQTKNYADYIIPMEK